MKKKWILAFAIVCVATQLIAGTYNLAEASQELPQAPAAENVEPQPHFAEAAKEPTQATTQDCASGNCAPMQQSFSRGRYVERTWSRSWRTRTRVRVFRGGWFRGGARSCGSGGCG